jgi:hypothetical protein
LTRLPGTQRGIFSDLSRFLVPNRVYFSIFCNNSYSRSFIWSTSRVHARSGVPAGHLQIRPASPRGWRLVTGSWPARLPIGALYLLASRRFGDRRAPPATRPPGCLLPIERLALADRNFDNGPHGEDPHCGNGRSGLVHRGPAGPSVQG